MKRKKKQEKSTTTLKETAISILYVMVMSAMVWVLTYFFNKSAAECIRNTITFAVGGFLVLFLSNLLHIHPLHIPPPHILPLNIP